MFKDTKYKTRAMMEHDLHEVHRRLLIAQVIALIILFAGGFLTVWGILTIIQGMQIVG